VLVAVLIIPALLDGPDKPADTVSRSLQLPATERAGERTHVIDLQPAEAGDEIAVVSDPGPVEIVDNDKPVAVTLPAAEPPAIVSSPEPQPQAPADDPVATAPLVAAPAGWAVQVGSFSSETNARRLAGLLQSSDYPAFVARHVVQGRVMYRVRVGPEPTRERALELAERLQEDRQQTQVVQHP
ncbi:MAG: SPOR domain-containing protein, partial [Gammaproteobacteria bacterium]|nr:SPOR domain-containing protein [Gammaproteobacteria bacterium]